MKKVHLHWVWILQHVTTVRLIQSLKRDYLCSWMFFGCELCETTEKRNPLWYGFVQFIGGSIVGFCTEGSKGCEMI
uniref:Uncharacterized protein n=1 Tax=Anguilla anguilla TaxID=7936 RepID=A0A0E9WUK1_ANGAN